VKIDRSSASASPAGTPRVRWSEMNAHLERFQHGYTSGTRRLVADVVRMFRRIPITANQVTAAGFSLNIVSAVLIYRELWVASGVVFLLGSILDVFDGAIARYKGEESPVGAFVDATVDRIAEGFVLGAIALVFARQGNTLALAAVFAALVTSFLTSYTRARAEIEGLDGISGLMARAERVVLLGAALLFAPLGTQVLPAAMYLLAALSAITVFQRVRHVLAQMHARNPR
jgi:CDP-diacylglycerol--glycerol-3-phosphate 3-phosphatidyltransferase